MVMVYILNCSLFIAFFLSVSCFKKSWQKFVCLPYIPYFLKLCLEDYCIASIEALPHFELHSICHIYRDYLTNALMIDI